MSLDERTLEWPNGKSGADYPAPCVRNGRRGLFTMFYCLNCPCDYNSAVSLEFCPLATDFRDAAEFEALVAAIMPYIVFRCIAEQAGQKDITIDPWECLTLARLAVEAEMEMEENNEKQSA